ncbi:MAG: polysaccharide biosynthesis tyrosine autokinase [Gammaproteobacteria bacterium]|nr:polysaccharide biosynthesis tyrosine autokinase [Gammaproteobacteria bacterium]
MLNESKLKRRLKGLYEYGDSHVASNVDQIIAAIAQYKWSILALASIVAFISLLISLSMPSIYQASAVILIEPPKSNIKTLDDIYGIDHRNGDFFLTQVELLRSRDLVARVIHDMELQKEPEFYIAPNAEDAESKSAISSDQIMRVLANKFLDRLSLRPVQRTHLVEIRFESTSPELSAKVANHLVKAYLTSSLENQLRMASDSSGWLADKLGPLKTELASAEGRLQDYLEKENLADIQGVRTLIASELERITHHLVEGRAKRVEVENLLSQLKSVKDWPSTPAIINHELVRGAYVQKQKAMSKVAELSERYGPEYPSMVSARSELEIAEKNLMAQMKLVVESFNRQYEVELKNEQSLNGSLENAKKELLGINRKEFQLKELQREVDTRRRLYDAFINQIQETNAIKDFEPVNARMIEHASVPISPYKPARTKIVSFSFIIALLSAIALAIALEYLKSTFKVAEDVTRFLEMPFLGYVPYIKNDGSDRLTVEKVFSGEGVSEAQEFINTIRTALLLNDPDSRNRITIVTSSVPEEGKSIVSGCIAAGLAQLNRVLLIDADMRRPCVHKLFNGLHRKTGIAEVLVGESTIEEALQHVDEYHLDVLPVGMIPPRPLDLLSSERFQSLLSELITRYDHIIIDTPPVHAVSDALVLSRRVHDVVFVTRYDSTSHFTARKALAQLTEARAKIAGVVLNQFVPPTASGSYELYQYMYKYGTE